MYFFLFLIVGTIYSQNLPSFRDGRYVDVNSFYGQNNTPDFTFTEGRRVNGIKNGNPENGTHNGTYRVIEEDGINYLIISWADNSTDKYLIIGRISNGYFYDFNLYNKDGIPSFSTGTIPSTEYITFFPTIISTEYITASSQLREGNTVYSTANMDERIGVCWAVRGGVGEKITIQSKSCPGGSLYISTGFISIEKPYLYRENSRPKKIRVSHEGENPKIINLADTYHVQSIDFQVWEKDVWIEILEVYPGTKYNDTCINFFRSFWAQ
jgi:hypothetical protein